MKKRILIFHCFFYRLLALLSIGCSQNGSPAQAAQKMAGLPDRESLIPAGRNKNDAGQRPAPARAPFG